MKVPQYGEPFSKDSLLACHLLAARFFSYLSLALLHIPVCRGGTGKAGHWAKWDTEVILTSQLKLARANKKLSAT